MKLCIADQVFALHIAPEIQYKTRYFSAILDRYGTLNYKQADFTITLTKQHHDFNDFPKIVQRKCLKYAERGPAIYLKLDTNGCIIDWSNKKMEILLTRNFRESYCDLVILYYIKIILSLLCIQKGGTAFHSSSIMVPGYGGCLFLGTSGAGKSTIAFSLKKNGYQVLNDEFNIIIPKNGEYVLYSTPFTGEFKLSLCTNDSVQLKQIFFTKKAMENKTEPITRQQYYCNALSHTYTLSTSDSSIQLLMQTIENITKTVTASVLHFKKGNTICNEFPLFLRENKYEHAY